MVDYFALALTHGLLALAGWRLLWRDDLDRDPEPAADDGLDAGKDRKPPKPAKPELRIRA